MSREEPRREISLGTALSHVTDLLGDVRFLTLCTRGSSGPWACTLAFAFDDDLDLFTISRKTTRHVRELQDDPRVAASLYDVDTTEDGHRRVRGLQLEGEGELAAGTDLLAGLKTIALRFARAEELRAQRLEARGSRVCRLIPERIVYLERGTERRRFELSRRGENWAVDALPLLASPTRIDG